jgi:hypothetical protein
MARVHYLEYEQGITSKRGYVVESERKSCLLTSGTIAAALEAWKQIDSNPPSYSEDGVRYPHSPQIVTIIDLE